MAPLPPIEQADLNHILAHSKRDLQELAGERLFITGGTGFFGTWMLEAIVAANRQFGANIEAWVLSRDPGSFAQRSPHLANAPDIHFISGDVTNFRFPDGSFSHVIHAATTASAQLNETRPIEMLNTIIKGTERVLEFAKSHGTQRVLLTSSGAVYGPQPQNIQAVPETYSGGPDCLSPHSAYAEGKRIAELLCKIAAQQNGIEIKIARCFAFVGPHLPLNAHFAIGNFIGDALKNQEIRVQGDGSPLRSYLYASDLVIWLIRILLSGQSCRPYNVGSDESVSISHLAHLIAAQFNPNLSVDVNKSHDPTQARQAYLPDTSRARHELGLSAGISLSESIVKTLNWHRAHQ
jgi:dTDP-glucose 4,6-dehydratase